MHELRQRDCPISGSMHRKNGGFIPIVQSIMTAAALVTAVLLFAQNSIQPQRAPLVLASGHIIGGLFAFLQTLD